MSKFMQNVNSNLLCAVAIEITGRDPAQHELLEVAIIPLDNDIRVSRQFRPYLCEIAPGDKVNIPDKMRISRERLCEIATRGVDAYTAAEYLVEWFEKLNLNPGKRIMPLAHDWPLVRSFLMPWLGPLTYDLCFSDDARDVKQAAMFCNDRAGWMGNDFPYPKYDLTYICSQLRIEYEKPRNVITDTRVIAETYRRIVKEAL